MKIAKTGLFVLEAAEVALTLVFVALSPSLTHQIIVRFFAKISFRIRPLRYMARGRQRIYHRYW